MVRLISMNDDDVDCYWSSLNRYYCCCYYLCCYYCCCCGDYDGDDGRKCYLSNFRYGENHSSDHLMLEISLMALASFSADIYNLDAVACEVIWKEIKLLNLLPQFFLINFSFHFLSSILICCHDHPQEKYTKAIKLRRRKCTRGKKKTKQYSTLLFQAHSHFSSGKQGPYKNISLHNAEDNENREKDEKKYCEEREKKILNEKIIAYPFLISFPYIINKTMVMMMMVCVCCCCWPTIVYHYYYYLLSPSFFF